MTRSGHSLSWRDRDSTAYKLHGAMHPGAWNEPRVAKVGLVRDTYRASWSPLINYSHSSQHQICWHSYCWASTVMCRCFRLRFTTTVPFRPKSPSVCEVSTKHGSNILALNAASATTPVDAGPLEMRPQQRDKHAGVSASTGPRDSIEEKAMHACFNVCEGPV